MVVLLSDNKTVPHPNAEKLFLRQLLSSKLGNETTSTLDVLLMTRSGLPTDCSLNQRVVCVHPILLIMYDTDSSEFKDAYNVSLCVQITCMLNEGRSREPR